MADTPAATTAISMAARRCPPRAIPDISLPSPRVHAKSENAGFYRTAVGLPLISPARRGVDIPRAERQRQKLAEAYGLKQASAAWASEASARAVAKAGFSAVSDSLGERQGLRHSGTLRDDPLFGSFSALPCKHQRTASRKSSRIR